MRAVCRAMFVTVLGLCAIPAGADAQDLTAVRVAHSAAEVPPDWVAIAVPGSCMAAPFTAGCPKVESVTFPSAVAVAQLTSDAAPFGTKADDTGLNVVPGDGSLSAARLQQTDPSAEIVTQPADEARSARASNGRSVASQAAAPSVGGECDLAVDRPFISFGKNGKYKGHGVSAVGRCIGSIVFVEVTDTLYRGGIPFAADFGADSCHLSQLWLRRRSAAITGGASSTATPAWAMSQIPRAAARQTLTLRAPI